MRTSESCLRKERIGRDSHSRLCRMRNSIRLADVLIPKATGDDAEAERRFKKMREEMGKREVYFERTYDHHFLFYSLREIMMRRTRSSDPVTY